jgi:AcrR family transcriptional regulator
MDVSVREEPGGHHVPHRGRPLDSERGSQLLNATLELLAEIGYDKLTMDAVAERAHASKATIYRRWSNKAELVVEALGIQQASLDIPDTGSLEGDLEFGLAQIFNKEARMSAHVMLGLITALSRDAELRVVFRERFLEREDRALKMVFDRAVARGEISPERDLELLLKVLPAFMMDYLLAHGEMPDRAFTGRVIHEVVIPLALSVNVAARRTR